MDYIGPIHSVLGPVNVEPFLDFIDDPRREDDWQIEAERAERREHRALLRALGIRDTRSSRADVQRVQSVGTLAGLHGAAV